MAANIYAVEVIDAWKKYSSKRVLNNISLRIPEGSVYGLLGASGCGKSTLLGALVGRVRLDRGQIKMAAVTSRADIGFMPQEITLFRDMSIKEHLNYFGRLYGMSSQHIAQRTKDLEEFLHLPSPDSLIKTLSSGTQRRVSLSIALLHSPRLLILDEPTVGVDIILSQSIWEKLLEMSRTEGRTVLITTHYIEEARRSDTIGLMRDGKLLAEEEPGRLMALHGCESLEETFMRLCQREEASEETVQDANSKKGDSLKPKAHLVENNSIKLNRITAHVLKNLFWMRRNIPMILFALALPVIQCLLASLLIGEKPRGLSIALVTEEVPSDLLYRCSSGDWLGPPACSDYGVPLSCLIAQALSNRSIRVVGFGSLEAAEKSVSKNNDWAVVYFNRQFSRSLKTRMRSLAEVLRNGTVLERGQMEVRLDTTNQVISNSLKSDLVQSLLEVMSAVSKHCGWKSSGTRPPIKIEEPVYGNRIPNIRQYMTPANAILFEFYFPVLFTVSVLIDEKTSGLLDRSLIAGLSLIEIAIGHIVMQYFILLLQTILEYLILFQFFDNMMIAGSFWPCFFLLLLTGTCGMFYGFSIVYQSNSFTEAAVYTFGGYFPIFILSGAIWPVEGMHWTVKWLASCLPVSRAVEAFRALSVRGWSLSHPSVLAALLSILIWTGLYCLVCLSLSKRRGLKL